jgi:hypothetical protein
MMELFSWIAGHWLVIVETGLMVVGGASVMVHAVAKLTPNKKDDAVAGLLDRVQGWLGRIALNPKK